MNRDQVEQVLQNIDIVDVVSDYLSLKKTGTNFKGLCPFHNEKTSSFVVSQDKQIFHCFGCHEGGDAISFLMKIEHLSFPEALILLAEKTGIKLDFAKQSNYDSGKNDLYEVNNRVADYYHNFLLKSTQAAKALAYLQKRDLSSNVINNFKLGFADDSFDSLLRVSIKNRINSNLMEKLGLLRKNKNNKLND